MWISIVDQKPLVMGPPAALETDLAVCRHWQIFHPCKMSADTPKISAVLAVEELYKTYLSCTPWSKGLLFQKHRWKHKATKVIKKHDTIKGVK